MSRLIRALVIHLTAQHHTTYKALQTIEQELITIHNKKFPIHVQCQRALFLNMRRRARSL
jgi:hypothetical protein